MSSRNTRYNHSVTLSVKAATTLTNTLKLMLLSQFQQRATPDALTKKQLSQHRGFNHELWILNNQFYPRCKSN